jgi:hypothetical protein
MIPESESASSVVARALSDPVSDEDADSLSRSSDEELDPQVDPFYRFSSSSDQDIDFETVEIIEPDENPPTKDGEPAKETSPSLANHLSGLPPGSRVSGRHQFRRSKMSSGIPALAASTTSPTVRADRYGWKLSSDVISEEERRLRQLESEQELRNEDRWRRMLGSWDNVLAHDPGKIEAAVMKGIPDCVRSRAWPLILDPRYESAQRQKVAAICCQDRPPSCATIDVDLKRTLPKMVMFSQTDVLEALRHILHAYAVMDTECGYVQGMAYPAAMLLSYMDEERAFWSFMGLMMLKFQLRRLYSNAFEGLNFLNTVWENLLEEKYRRVAQNLNALKVVPNLYTPNWFLTAFMAVEFRPEIRLAIFDRFVAFGCRALVSFALVIIARNRHELARKPIRDCLAILQRPDKCERLMDWRALMAKFDKLFLSEKEYNALFKRANLPLIQ